MEADTAFVDAHLRRRVVAAALAAAGVLALAAAALPGMEGAHRGGLGATGLALLALAGVAGLLLEHLGRTGLHLQSAWAVLVLGAGVLLAGGGVASAALGVLLCWPVLATAAFLGPRAAAAHAAFASAVYGAALLVAGAASPLWAWLALTATLGVSAVAASVLGARVRTLASTDERTGTISARFWEEMVSRECARAARSGHPLCVAVVSVDGLGDYHRAGHMAGEQFLRETAHAWNRSLRGGDLLSHLQSDEFGVLLAECGDAAARAVVDRLRASTPDGRTSSAGIALWNGEESSTALVNRACEALRHARRAGRDQSFIAAA